MIKKLIAKLQRIDAQISAPGFMAGVIAGAAAILIVESIIAGAARLIGVI